MFTILLSKLGSLSKAQSKTREQTKTHQIHQSQLKMIANDYSKLLKKSDEISATLFIKNLKELATTYNMQRAGVLPKSLIKDFMKLFEDVENSFAGMDLKQLIVILRINEQRAELETTHEQCRDNLKKVEAVMLKSYVDKIITLSPSELHTLV